MTTNINFVALNKYAKKADGNLPGIKLAITGDCSTQHLATAVKGYGFTENLHIDIYDVDYNQMNALLLNPLSELYEFNPAIILLYMSVEKLYDRYASLDADHRRNFADDTYSLIEMYWQSIGKNSNSKVIQFNFAEIDDCVFGNYANKIPSSFLYQLRKLNLLLMDGCSAHKNVFIIDLCRIQAGYGRDVLFDDKMYYVAKMPLSTVILPHVAQEITGIIKAVNGQIRKCIVLDLDNTLWGGVIGDDGMEGIEIGELGRGPAFSDFQRWLKLLKERGILLSVCSKNNEKAAKEPFLHHPEMILRMEDITVFKANWQDKAQNIREIRDTLNIGMDSIVFIDDNRFERELVRSLIPEITVPELPEDPALYLAYLQRLNLFETASFSEADTERTNQYQAELNRAVTQTQFESYEEYLKSLDMVAEAKAFDPFHYPRIAQLSQRSNQFNLRTVRYSEEEIGKIADDDNYITLYFTLRDKFGDHGLVSVVILKKQNRSELFIHDWMMSCRVLKRGMEEFIINKIVQTASDYSFEKVIGEYIRTPKNVMVEDLYEKLGFTRIGDNHFKVDVKMYTPHEVSSIGEVTYEN